MLKLLVDLENQVMPLFARIIHQMPPEKTIDEENTENVFVSQRFC